MSKVLLSAVVLAKNEEENIKKCLNRLMWCDEIVVIDDFSTDGTTKIAKQFQARVYKRKLGGDFASQRNFALRKAKFDWVLFIDADELVSKKLAREIRMKTENDRGEYSSYSVKRVDIVYGKKLTGGEHGSQHIVRLVKRNHGQFVRSVHEYWVGRGKTGRLQNVLFHHPLSSLSSYLLKQASYSRLHAGEKLKEGGRSSLFKILFYPVLKFLHNYIVRHGNKDGVCGLVVSMFMSFHSFLSWSTVYLKQDDKQV